MIRRSKKKQNYAFIDSQNLNLGTQRMGWKVDWRRFRQYLKDRHNVSKAYMFIGYMQENEALYEYMHELGFLVVLKPTVDIGAAEQKKLAAAEAKASESKIVTDPKAAGEQRPTSEQKPIEKEKTNVKGNVDAELVLYAMKELPNYKQAIIVSGDGDFFSLAEYLNNQGKLANILTPNWQYSSLLKVFDSKIIRLDQMRKDLAYKDRGRKKR